MLWIHIPKMELYDEQKQEFVDIKETRFSIEHSLKSIHKWEQKWHIPFLSSKHEKTTEMIIDYIRCMTITQNVDPKIYNYLPDSEIEKIHAYINDPATATTFSKIEEEKAKAGNKRGDVVTAEIIYYWMISFNIPIEFQNWHLESLLTLIKVCSIKNEEQNPSSKKKLSRSELNARNARLNAQRKRMLNTRG